MYKVMLVDDELSILKGLQSLIPWEEHGLEVAGAATSGTQALEMAEQCKFHIVITDIKMPKMSGLELIRHLKEKDGNVRYVILSGYNDFDYVKEAFKLGIDNYLLKPVNEEELSQTLLNIIDAFDNELKTKMSSQKDSITIKNNILNRWVANTISPVEFLERAKLLNIDLNFESFLVCLIRIKNTEHGSLNQDPAILRHAIMNICKETFKGKYGPEVFLDLSGDIVLLFSGDCPATNRDDMAGMLKGCIRKINQNTQTDVFVTVGSVEKEFGMVNSSYLNAKALMDYILLQEPNSILDFEEKQLLNQEFIQDMDIDAEYFKDLILSNKRQEVVKYIDGIYEKPLSDSNILPKTIQSISIEMLYIIMQCARESGNQSSRLAKLSRDLYKILNTNIKADLVNIVKESLYIVLDHLKENSDCMHPLIKRAIEYTDANLSMNLSLKVLSSVFNTHPCYLGQLFKKETGEMYSNYLNRVRIQKAKSLLSESNMHSNEVALKVGYLNANYFYTCFKKYTGIFPTEYRRDMNCRSEP